MKHENKNFDGEILQKLVYKNPAPAIDASFVILKLLY